MLLQLNVNKALDLGKNEYYHFTSIPEQAAIVCKVRADRYMLLYLILQLENKEYIYANNFMIVGNGKTIKKVLRCNTNYHYSHQMC